MPFFKLEQTGNVPVTFEGEMLVGDQPSEFVLARCSKEHPISHFSNALFRTTSGRFILLVRHTRGYGMAYDRCVHLDVDKLSATGIIDLMGSFWAARGVLKALGKQTEQVIE